jgi:hypothetical protein
VPLFDYLQYLCVYGLHIVIQSFSLNLKCVTCIHISVFLLKRKWHMPSLSSLNLVYNFLVWTLQLKTTEGLHFTSGTSLWTAL